MVCREKKSVKNVEKYQNEYKIKNIGIKTDRIESMNRTGEGKTEGKQWNIRGRGEIELKLTEIASIRNCK